MIVVHDTVVLEISEWEEFQEDLISHKRALETIKADALEEQKILRDAGITATGTFREQLKLLVEQRDKYLEILDSIGWIL